MSEQQEWTPVYGNIDCGDSKPFLHVGTLVDAKAICDCHNAALAAERQRSVDILRKKVSEFAEQSGKQIKLIKQLSGCKGEHFDST
ncbi:MAG TPA: hypothetical protein VFQ43_10415 [Nitrososphaera sp.]|nr:hypothetical protein [Nitrososphaera sp.]